MNYKQFDIITYIIENDIKYLFYNLIEKLTNLKTNCIVLTMNLFND